MLESQLEAISTVRMNTPHRINTPQYNPCWYIKLGVLRAKIYICPLSSAGVSEITKAMCDFIKWEITCFLRRKLYLLFKRIIPMETENSRELSNMNI